MYRVDVFTKNTMQCENDVSDVKEICMYVFEGEMTDYIIKIHEHA